MPIEKHQTSEFLGNTAIVDLMYGVVIALVSCSNGARLRPGITSPRYQDISLLTMKVMGRVRNLAQITSAMG
jgi:hypothetical protein